MTARDSQAWSLTGSEGLEIRGATHMPSGRPLAAIVVVHGFTGNMHRNIVPAVTVGMTEKGYLCHRLTLSHAGVGPDGDSITRLDEFERDSVQICLDDIRIVVESIASGTLAGRDLPLVLIGHSRGGAQVLGAAGRAAREGWAMQPAGVISLAGVKTYAPLDDVQRAMLELHGFLEREVGRATGGRVRLGRSWFEHDLNNPGRDVFAEDVSSIRCPVLLVHGSKDVSVPIEHQESLHELITGTTDTLVESITVDDADHNFNALGVGLERQPLQSPASAEACEAIDRFLNRCVLA